MTIHDLEKLKGLAEKLGELISHLEKAEELASDPGLSQFIEADRSEPGIMGSVWSAVEDFGDDQFTAVNVLDMLAADHPKIAEGLDKTRVGRILNKFYAAGRIVRLQQGTRGRHGQPAVFANRGHLDNE